MGLKFVNKYNDILADIRNIVNGKEAQLDTLKLLYKHQCFYALTKAENSLSETMKFSLQKIFKLNQIKTQEYYKNCEKFFLFCNENNISYAVMKGAVLSRQIYGNVQYRICDDIDVLICYKDIDKIKSFLLQDDFVQGYSEENGIKLFDRERLIFYCLETHQIAPFIKRGNSPICPYINLDINTSIIWGESKKPIDTETVLTETEEMEICNIKVKKLRPEMELIALCLHIYKDANSLYLLYKKNMCLSAYFDLYYYLKSIKIDTRKLQILCEKMGVKDYLYFCIYYTNIIFRDAMLDGYLSMLHTKYSDKILNVFGLEKHEIQEWGISFEERLFSQNIRKYLLEHCSTEQIEKIKANQKYL